MRPGCGCSGGRLGLLLAAQAVAALARLAVASEHRLGGLQDLLQAEARAWREAGHPEALHFPDNHLQPAVGEVVADHRPSHAHTRAAAAVQGRVFGHSVEALFAPFMPSDGHVRFHVFTARNDSDILGKLVDVDKESILAAGWNSSWPTKVVVHGFTSNIESRIIQDIKNAYLGQGPHNIVAVDWGDLCPAPLYKTARLNTVFAGERVGLLLRALVADGLAGPDSLHLIGHSLGAHVAGMAAKALRDALGKRPHRLTGLDPALPLFLVTPPAQRLSKDDADVVDVSHTCAGRLGFRNPIGTFDFYINGGRLQPDCGIDLTCACAHVKSYVYYVESIKEGIGFKAHHCQNHEDALNETCKGKFGGCVGSKINTTQSGSYYVKTSEKC